MNELVAFVEDDEDIRLLVGDSLKKERFRVKGFPNARSFLAFLGRETPDLVLLDVMLPDADGLDLCRKLRSDQKYSSVAVIMLTARVEEIDRVLGLELGADDYVSKPFSPKELVARIKAVLRRYSKHAVAPDRIDAGGGLIVNLDTFEASLEGRNLELTASEFRLLQLFASRIGWVFPREKILDALWGEEKNVTDRSVDVHIKNLRDKLGAAGRRIVTVRGVGYKLVE
jgi:two-component system phosphate regulon response regulator PhoB/two-component system alkaline phosphatase synthesis response regulator PhoP